MLSEAAHLLPELNMHLHTGQPLTWSPADQSQRSTFVHSMRIWACMERLVRPGGCAGIGLACYKYGAKRLWRNCITFFRAPVGSRSRVSPCTSP